MNYREIQISPDAPFTTPTLIVQRGEKEIKLRHPAYHAAIAAKSSGKKNTMNRRVLDELMTDERFAL